VLSIVYRAREHRSDLVVLDAWDLATVAVVRLPHHVPPGFHGTFVPGPGAARPGADRPITPPR
jgi:carotenoid cleavage dioxygenase-like enzyme